MKNCYFSFVFILFLIILGNISYPQQGGNWVNNYDGIPIHTELDWYTWLSGIPVGPNPDQRDTIINAMQRAGIDFIESRVNSNGFLDSMKNKYLKFRIML